jgi:hypothetical protein
LFVKIFQGAYFPWQLSAGVTRAAELLAAVFLFYFSRPIHFDPDFLIDSTHRRNCCPWKLWMDLFLMIYWMNIPLTVCFSGGGVEKFDIVKRTKILSGRR